MGEPQEAAPARPSRRDVPRVTSRDVAREAGVSQTTVSFVLNGRDEHGIAQETRRHVLATARRLGYVPSASARSLRAGKSHVVVCLIPDLPVSEAFETMKRRLSAALAEQGYACAFFEATWRKGRLAEMWRHVEPAAVVSFAALDPRDAAVLRASSVPVIEDVLRPDGARLRHLDQREIGATQVRYLASQGHRRLAVAAIADPREQPFCAPRVAGARQACSDLGLAAPVEVTVEYSTDSALSALDELRRLDQPPSAVAAFNDLVGLALMGACRVAQVRVPEELAIIGVDDLPAAGLSVPGLTTIRLDLAPPARSLAMEVVAAIGGELLTDDPTDSDVLQIIRRGSA